MAKKDLYLSIVISFVLRDVVTALVYTRTEGKSDHLKDGSRLPEKIEILDCITLCEKTSQCYCVRLSTVERGFCQVFNGTPGIGDSNGLNHTNYVYYAQTYRREILEPNSNKTDNLALLKPSYQSSTYELAHIKYTADKANDGVRNVEGFIAPYFAHTKDGEEANSFPWWQVDLEEEFLIIAVKILNRRRFAERLHDFEVRVGQVRLSEKYNDQHFKANLLCHKHEGGGIGDAKNYYMKCTPCPLRGRYVNVQIVAFCTDCEEHFVNILQLAEVDVYGHNFEEIAEATAANQLKIA